MVDPARASMNKLRRLMRRFNLAPTQRNTFNLEVAMLTGGDKLLLPALPTMAQDGQTAPLLLATASHGLVSVTVYSSKRLVPASYKILQLLPMTVPELIELTRTQAVNTIHIDPFTCQSTSFHISDGEMKLAPVYGAKLRAGIDPFEHKPD